ncbi:MAG: DNA-3-methyladenine glycosylase 2 family protein, partial [Gemmatimonadota bacterium]|nr:DNA-3-methyladenine glycosylase 2 family protein [Gemmatimonadota bacterium]
LARIVLEQQVSLRSATSLFRRVDRTLAGGITAAGVARAGVRGLRAVGLTRQKAAYLVALAESTTDGSLDFRRLARLDDAAAFAALTGVHGIGPWSASIYLLMALRRPDVWPPGDLALHVALARLRRQNRVPLSAEAARYAERWRPWRSVAARILWHAYLSERPARGAGGG